MADLLPVGAYVLVTERGELARPPRYAIVRGYDVFRTKYELGNRYGGWGTWLFAKGGSWAFPGECREVTKAEATAIPSRPTTTAPAAGSLVRITERWPQGTVVTHEGHYTGWREPDWELDGHHCVPYSAAGHNNMFGDEPPVVTVEILAGPEVQS